MVVRRRKFRRYGSTELGVPPLKVKANSKNIYPSFPPEAGSFNHDGSLRTATSYSTYDYQIYTNSRFENPDFYRKAIIQGVDLFKKSSNKVSKWLKKGSEDKDYEERRKYNHESEDTYGYTTEETMWDIFPFLYSFYNIFYEILNLFRTIFYLVRHEQTNIAIFTYYYFYWYFFFSEYILEHLFLYFPVLRIFFSIQLWTNLDQTYFSFYELWLGFYFPFTVIFLFSQYYIFKNLFNQASYVLAGVSVFFSIILLTPIYYFSGYSSIFIFFFLVVFSSVFSIFYIFEFKNSFYFSPPNISFNNYFLTPPSSTNKEVLYLPIFYYHFNRWPNKSFNTSPQAVNRKFFTRFPFTQNIDSILIHKQRVFKTSLNYFKYASLLGLSSYPVNIPVTGLIFPRFTNLASYSFKDHIKSISTYPRPNYEPIEGDTELEDWEEVAEDPKSYTKEFINYFDGRSQISFLDLVSKSKSLANFSSNPSFRYLEQNFHQFSSQTLMSYLYPYVVLGFWLKTLNPNSEFSQNSSNFNPIKLDLYKFEPVAENLDIHQPKGISNWFIIFIDYIYSRVERILNYLTFYRGYRFKKVTSTFELTQELEKIIKILSDRNFVSFYFYYRLIFFLPRILRLFFFTFRHVNFSFPLTYISTYAILLQQFEDLYLILIERKALIKNYTKSYRCVNFCCNLLYQKIITRT